MCESLQNPVDAASLVKLLHANRFKLSDEKETQVQVEKLLSEAGIAFEREAALSTKDVVDFLVAGGIAVELKIKGQRRAIYRQLERYATHDDVREIVLATSVAMRLPPTILGKPAVVASLSQGWL